MHRCRKSGFRSLGPLVLGVTCFLLLAPVGALGAAWQGNDKTVDLTSTGQNATVPQVAMNQTGTSVAVWLRSDGTNTLVQASTRPPGGSSTWATANQIQTLSTAGQNASSPQVAINASGEAVAVWSRSNGTNTIIQASVLSAGSSTWTTPQDISDAGQNAAAPQIAIDSSGNAVVVWSRSNGTNTIIQSKIKSAGSTSFATTGQDLSLTGQNAAIPDIAMTSSGYAVVVWRRSNGTNTIIQAVTKAASSITFGAASDLSATGQDAATPRVEVNSGGDAVVVWVRSNGTFNLTQAATLAAGSSTWSSAETLSATTAASSEPQVGISSSGEANAVWTFVSGANTVINTAKKTAGSSTWGSASTLSTTNQNSTTPQIFVDPAGDVVVVWSTTNAGGNVLIESVTRAAADSSYSSIQSLSATGAGQNATVPQVAGDPDGDAVAVWQRSNGTNTVIQTLGFDRGGPTFSSTSIPSTGTVGTAVSVSASTNDVWSTVSSTTWNFGDGSTGSGTSTTHTYTAAGTYTVTVTATDALGNSRSTTGSIVVSAASSSSGSGTTTATTTPTLSIKKVTLSGRNLVIAAACGKTMACSGTLTVKTKSKLKVRGKKKVVTLGKAKVSIAAGKTKSIKIKISNKNLALLRKIKSRKVKLVVTSVLTDSAGNKVTKKKTVTLKIPKKKKK